MKLAIHQPRISYYVGGGERIPLKHAEYLNKRGHDITIVTSKMPEESEMFKLFKQNNKGVKIAYFDLFSEKPEVYTEQPGKNQLRWDLETINFARLVLPFYADKNFDMIATHYTVDALAVPPNKKQALHLHGFPHVKREIDEITLGIPDTLISVADFVTQNWKEMYDIQKTIHLCYNGMDPEEFKPLDFKKDIDIFYIGRLIPIKGVDTLIKSVAKVKESKENIKVAIGGTGPQKEELEELTKRLGLEQNIKFLGYVNDENLLLNYNQSKIAIFPSYAREGVLTTMLEAASCETAIITGNCCGMKEFLKHERNGLLIEPQNQSQLTDYVLRLLNDEQLREKLGKQARKDIISEWNWDKRIIELEKIYEKTIK